MNECPDIVSAAMMAYMSGWTIALLLAAVVVTWLLFWVAVVRLIARFGWRSLAMAYPLDRAAFEGERITMQTALLRRWVSYKKSITFTASREGVMLTIHPFFKFGHAPILLPWSELTITQETRMLMKMIRLEPRRAPQVPILISASLGNRLKNIAGDEWPGK